MAYKCAVCGKSYDNFHDRAACESTCIEKWKKDEAARKKADQEKIKNELIAKIRAKIDETTELIKSYKEITGEEPELTTTYSYSTDMSDIDFGKALKAIRLPSFLEWLF